MANLQDLPEVAVRVSREWVYEKLFSASAAWIIALDTLANSVTPEELSTRVCLSGKLLTGSFLRCFCIRLFGTYDARRAQLQLPALHPPAP